jgi:hypothetical protein
MKKAEAAFEYAGILRLLREHAFLRYSSTGRQEYDQRLLSANLMFCNLVSRATGLVLPPPPVQYTELDRVSDGSYAGLVRMARRIAVRLRRKPPDCTSQEALRLERLGVGWDKAAKLLSSLQD